MEWNKRSEQWGDLCRGARKVAGTVKACACRPVAPQEVQLAQHVCPAPRLPLARREPCVGGEFAGVLRRAYTFYIRFIYVLSMF